MDDRESTTTITTMSKQIIPNMTVIHEYYDNHVIIKCTVRTLMQQCDRIKNWKFNRPPDYMRCREIAKHIMTKKPKTDWLFYAIYKNASDDSIYIIDGIHRFTAFKLIYAENSKPIDLLTPSEFCGDLSWLYDQYIMISLRTNTSEGEEVDLFRQINMSNPVPDLYIQNPHHEKRCLIEEVVKKWQDKYHTHFSSNSKPNIPNINRDRFIEILNYLCDKYNIDNSNEPQKLEEILYEMNNKIRQNLPKKISQKSLEKCVNTGCYLFLVRQDILHEMFE